MLSGCGIGPYTRRTSNVATLHGSIHGGQQPIAGATVQLYQVGLSGDGSAASSLLTSAVTTDSNGEFSLANDFYCPYASDLVYLLATGGNPGLGSGQANPQIAEMAALGACGDITSSTYISVNEVTTVASVYALAPYMSSPTAIGSALSDEVSLGLAISLANQLANPATGAAPGLNIPAGQSVPVAQIDTIANILATCINSPGGVSGDSSPCGTFIAYTTPAGKAPPTDAVSALLNLARNPTLNTPGLYALTSPASPFQPNDSVQPPDLSIQLTRGSIPVTVTLSAASPAVFYGQTSFSATVSNPAATGTISFLIQNSVYLNSLGTVPVNQGSASVTAPFFPGGSFAVTALYSGDSIFAPATSAPYSETIETVPTTTSLTASPSSIPLGGTITLTANVAHTLPTGTAQTSGSILFRDSPTPAAVNQTFYPGLNGYGDSIMGGAVASTIFNAFFDLTAAYFPPGTGNNYGYGGDQSEDLVLKVLNNNPLTSVTAESNPATLVEDGANDHLFCNGGSAGSGSAGCLTNYSAANLAADTWLAIPNIIPNGSTPYITKISGQSCVPSGAWANSTTAQVSSLAIASSTQGSTLTCSITSYGGPLYAYWEAWDSNTGTMSVSIDGEPRGVLDAFGFDGQTISTKNGGTHTVFGARYTVPLGAHTVVFSVTSPTGVANLNSVVGLATPPPPNVLPNGGPFVVIMGVLHSRDYVNDTVTGEYNAAAQTLQTQLQADGLNVAFADTRDVLNDTTDLGPGTGNVHPDDQGHAKIAAVLLPLLQPGAPGAAIVGSAQLSGQPAQATATFSNLSAGTHYLIATYGGDGNFASSASAPITVTVGAQTGSGSSSSGAGNAQEVPPPIAPLVDLPFLDGSGSVAADTSGNNNNCTLQSATGRTPTWIANGLSFANGQGCDLPPSANPAQTWCFSFFAPPVPPNANAPGSVTGLLFSNGGLQGLNLLSNYAGSQAQSLYSNIYGASILSGTETPLNPSYGYVVTAANETFVGPTRACYVLGTPGVSLDHLYIDGREDTYDVQNASAGVQTSSFLSIAGANNPTWASAGGNQTLFHVLAFAAPLAVNQVQQIDQYLLTEQIQRSIAQTPTPNIGANARLIFDGDSMTAGVGLTHTASLWTSHLTLTNQPAYDMLQYSVPGITALGLASSEPYRVAELCQTAQGPSLVTQWSGTNDLEFFPFAGPQVVFQNIMSELTKVSEAGCKVFVFTLISRVGNAADGGNFETERAAVNSLILQQAKLQGAFGIVDMASVPLLGATGAYANPTFACFQADQTHPADACEPYIAQTVSNSLNYYTGSTLSAPSIYTSGATLQSADRVADVSGCTAACNFTLPDGSGPTGEIYTILTGASPTTVQGLTIYGYTQTVNGSSTPVTLPPHARVSLQIVALPQANAGIAWQILP